MRRATFETTKAVRGTRTRWWSGVSTHSAKPHGNFAAKFDLLFTLVANPNKQDVSAYGV